MVLYANIRNTWPLHGELSGGGLWALKGADPEGQAKKHDSQFARFSRPSGSKDFLEPKVRALTSRLTKKEFIYFIISLQTKEAVVKTDSPAFPPLEDL